MADGPRLLTDATEAFVDGASIDWSALSSRVRTPPDRALVASLRDLAALRSARPLATAAPSARRAARIIAWLLVAMASLQTVALLGVIAAAAAAGAAPTDRLPQLLLALAFAAAGLVVSAAAEGDGGRLFLLATYVASAAVFARSAVDGLPGDWPAPADNVLRGIEIEAFIPACLWEFALTFPRVDRFTAFDRIGRIAASGAWLLAAVLFAANVEPIADTISPLQSLQLAHSSDLFWRLSTLALAPLVPVILVRTRRAPALERRRVGRLALALAVGIGPFLALGVIRTIIPAVNDWFKAGLSPAVAWIYGAIVIALAAAPALGARAVVADRPFELPLPWRRGSFGALAKRIVLAVVAAPISIAGVVRRHRRLPSLLQCLSSARGTRETATLLSDIVRRELDVSSVSVMLRTSDGRFSDVLGDKDGPHADSGLAALLGDAAVPIDLSLGSAVLTLLPPDERDWAITNDVQLIAPLRRRDDALVGVLTIGPRTRRRPFDSHDRSFVAALTAAAAAAADDAASMPRNEAAFECPACGLVDPSMNLSCGCGAGSRLAALPLRLGGKFLVVRRLGAGGMGIVYLARDLSLDRLVALKTLPRLTSGAARQLRNEARSMAALDHAALATVYGLEIWRRAPVLVVEYCPFGTLADRLRGGALGPAEASAIGCRLADALVYMHGRGLRHRDVKPSNIAFAANGGVKLLDFGLAAPDGDASPAADLWALAIVMLEAATGSRDPSSVHRPWPAAHLALQSFLRRALAPSPDARFQTSLEFRSALESVTADARPDAS